MGDIFVDTSGRACWLDQSQPFHGEAVRIVAEATDRGHRLVTTSYVLVELTALLTSPLRMPKPSQIAFLANLRSDSSILHVSIEREAEADAWDLWASRPDKDWSLVDCSSFVVMQKHALTQALTTDHHFEQAGFVRLLK
jgi:predicted nucleic acid-binding protein